MHIVLLVLAFICTACSSHRVPAEISSISEHKIAIPKREELIVIDAGHGGRDSGSASHREDYEEKSLTLSTAFLVQDFLHKLGYKTVLTRNHDTYIPLNTRAEIANSLEADLFVSIHYNFAASREAQGVEVYYYKDERNPGCDRITESKILASQVISSVIGQTSANSRGVKQANFAVIRETKMPAILIEAGFLSNPKERELLRDPRYLRQLAWGIAKGIERYHLTN